VKMTPVWWGRSLYYYQIGVQEPIGVVLAMQSTQEGQQPALHTEVVLPALSSITGLRPAPRRSSSSPSTRPRMWSTASDRPICAPGILTTRRSRPGPARLRNRRACCVGLQSRISIAANISAKRTFCHRVSRDLARARCAPGRISMRQLTART
jgi:hypothetical protein